MPGRRLGLWEREEISRGCRWGSSLADIARRIERPTSTVSREVKRVGGREQYRAWFAQIDAQVRRRRPKPNKLLTNRPLAAAVSDRLEKKWSPEQIARRLRLDHPDDPSLWVSHETIYKSLFLQGRGGLRKELTKALRTGRARRRPRGRSPYRGHPRVLDMVMISERPAEVADRAVPGHWEGDLIIGYDSGSQVGTLVERTSRLCLLVHLPRDRRAETVREAVGAKIQDLPDHLRRTLTWDQGKEMAQHIRFRIDTGVAVYFCDPHSPWQRGTAENTIRLLRQYLPKSTDLSRHTEAQLDEIADELNCRPRKTHAWMTPSEKFTELVAMAR
jgi:IS30 family transposase